MIHERNKKITEIQNEFYHIEDETCLFELMLYVIYSYSLKIDVDVVTIVTPFGMCVCVYVTK